MWAKKLQGQFPDSFRYPRALFRISVSLPTVASFRRRRTRAAAGMEDALIKHQGFCRRCIDVVFILSSLMSTCELDRFVIQVPYIKVRAEVLLGHCGPLRGRAGDRSGAALQDWRTRGDVRRTDEEERREGTALRRWEQPFAPCPSLPLLARSLSFPCCRPLLLRDPTILFYLFPSCSYFAQTVSRMTKFRMTEFTLML